MKRSDEGKADGGKRQVVYVAHSAFAVDYDCEGSDHSVS